jgi:4-amino-4-deoxy-L-arabinose transferase-like glycosyltransferase
MLDSETVETVSSAQDTPINRTPAARIGWAVLILLTLYVCYFSHLGAIGFVGPDEPRYAWIARDMGETGDWVTPRLYGKPWFEKPPLFYWGAALSFKLFGVSEAAARLPSAISALLATLALAWLALRLYGAETARWLLLLLPTTVGMIGFSHAAATDMPFSAMLTIAMVCAAVVLGLIRDENSPVIPHTPWLALILFGFSLGLAVLAKGPAAIILSGGAIFLWALFTKRWRDAFRLLHPAAIASFCLTALPWYVLCARRNPDFFRIFIIEHNFKRFLTPEFQHVQPFWFYLPVLLVAFLPWTGATLWATVASGARLARSRNVSPRTLLLLSWALFVLFFFSVSQSKLPGYILPAVPAFSLLLAHGCVNLAIARRKSFALSLAAFSTIFFGLAVLADRLRLQHSPRAEDLEIPAVLLLIIIVVLNLVFATAFFFMTTPWARNLLACVCVIAIPFTLVAEDFLVSERLRLSTRVFAGQLEDLDVPLDRTFVYRGMGRNLRYGLNFYLHREVPDWDQNLDLEAYIISDKPPCADINREALECAPVSLGSPHQWFVAHVTPK